MSLMRQHAEPIQGWLQDVQRDPRSVGAFRRRIQCLLRDPAVARRVAGRLDRRLGDGPIGDGEFGDGRFGDGRFGDGQFGDRRLGDGRPGAAERPATAEAPRCGSELPAGLSPRLAGQLAGSSGEALSGTLIGRCDCERPCVLMAPDLRRFDTLAPRPVPVPVRLRA